jgi:hypothetical protein
MKTLSIDEFRRIVVANQISRVAIVADGAGFVVHAECRDGPCILGSSTGGTEISHFPNRQKALVLLQELGVDGVADIAEYVPLSAPDSYDEWFRKKVQGAIDGLADGTNQTISEEEWNEIAAAKKVYRDAL